MGFLQTKKSVIFKAVFLLSLLFLLSTISSELTPLRDVEIKIILENPEPYINYTEIFRVENLDHKTGTTDLLHFYINATIKNKNETKKWNTTRSINKFTQTGMGIVYLETGKYELCVDLTPLNFHDYNLSNNRDCKIITTSDYEFENETSTEEDAEEADEQEEPEEEYGEEPEEEKIGLCECPLQIITEKQIYKEGESISFIIRDCWETTTFQEEVEYWAEDLFGKITKTKLLTKSKAAKSYTPRISEEEKTFILKARIKTCNNTASKIVTVKGEEPEEKQTKIEIKTQGRGEPGEIIILDLQGYKGQTQKTLIDIQLELENKRKSQTLKAYIPTRNQEFSLRIPFQLPQNLPEGEFEYEITAKGLDQEEKTTIIINTPVKELKPEQIRITNIYTRKQKFDGGLNIITAWEGADEATLRFTTQQETKEITTQEKTITTALRIKKHNETIIAEIIKNNETQHIQILRLQLETDEEEKTPESSNSQKNYDAVQESEESAGNETTKQEQITPKAQEKTDETKIESEKTQKEKETRITAQTASFIARNKKQTIFVVLATASLIFLFRKEITAQTKKIKTLL